MLQKDARNNSPATIAENVGVSANTVRNRIERLEGHGVIEGYHPQINYEQAGYQLHVFFICSVAVSDRRSFAEAAFAIEGVTRVCEMLAGRKNLIVETVGEDTDDITAIATELEALGCDIAEEWFLKSSQVQPFDHFGKDAIEE